MAVVDIETLSAEDLRHLAHLADQREQRQRYRLADLLERPALGAFSVPSRKPNGPNDWLRADPDHIANIMDEMSRFTRDEMTILRAISSHVELIGIPDHVAEPAIREGLRQLRSKWAASRAS